MGARPPVGPTSAYSKDSVKQHRVAIPRQRRCLLKGCEAWFRSVHPLARYCSGTCQKAARRWTQCRANRRYRRSEQGKECRREQCQRRRQRDNSSTTDEAMGREGYQEADEQKKLCCSRPGCYEYFAAAPRSPLKKFCSRLCCRALRRVLQREARWRGRWERLASSLSDLCSRRC